MSQKESANSAAGGANTSKNAMKKVSKEQNMADKLKKALASFEEVKEMMRKQAELFNVESKRRSDEEEKMKEQLAALQNREGSSEGEKTKNTTTDDGASADVYKKTGKSPLNHQLTPPIKKKNATREEIESWMTEIEAFANTNRFGAVLNNQHRMVKETHFDAGKEKKPMQELQTEMWKQSSTLTLEDKLYIDACGLWYGYVLAAFKDDAENKALLMVNIEPSNGRMLWLRVLETVYKLEDLDPFLTMNKFHGMEWNKKESPADFMKRLQQGREQKRSQLYTKTTDYAVLDMETKLLFVNGLKRRELMTIEPDALAAMSFEQLVSKATQLNHVATKEGEYKSGGRGIKTGPRGDVEEPGTAPTGVHHTGTSDGPKRLREIKMRQGWKDRKNTDKRPRFGGDAKRNNNCFYCDKPGHRKRDCKAREANFDAKIYSNRLPASGRAQKENSQKSGDGGRDTRHVQFQGGYTGAHHVSVLRSEVLRGRHTDSPSDDELRTFRCDSGCEMTMTPYARLLTNIRAGGDGLSLQGPFDGAPLIGGSKVGDMEIATANEQTLKMEVIYNPALRGSLLSDRQVQVLLGARATIVYRGASVTYYDANKEAVLEGVDTLGGWTVKLNVQLQTA